MHRNGSTRLRHYDYGRNGFYFVTICTKPRSDDFGKIINGEMKYTDLGYAAIKCWQKITKHFPFVMLDEFVIMSDHVHGIIIINKINDVRVGAHNYARLRVREPSFSGNKFGPQSQNLGSIIRSYKIAVKQYANQHNVPFAWQPRYYDRIIRNERELNNVRRYIRNNPWMWHN